MADSTPSQYTIMTNAALALIKQLVDSKNRIKSFRAVASDANHFTDDQEAIAEMTAIDSVKQDGVIQDIQDNGDAKSYIQIDFDQSKIDTAYQLQTVGLFATDEKGKEILYAVECLEHPQYMDVSQTMDMNSHFIHIVVGNTQQLDVSLTPAGTVSVAQLESKLADYVKTDEVKSLIPATVIDGSKPADFKEAVTLEKGAVDGAGNAIATTKNVSDGDAKTLTSAKEYADTQASGKADDSTVVHTADMRKPASDVAGIEEVNVKQDKIGYTPADDSKVVHDNHDGTEQLNGVQVQPFNKLSDTIGGRNLLPGTSGTLQIVTNASGWNNNLPVITPVVTTIDSDTTYTASAWISPASHDVNIQIAWKDARGIIKQYGSNVISAGTSGYSTLTGTITAGSTIKYVTIAFRELQSTPSSVSYKEMKFKQGSVDTDWTPAPEDKVNVADMRKPASDVAGIEEVSAKQDKIGYTPANAANVVDRNPDTGVVSEPVDFTKLTVEGGKSVATRDDLKSLETSAWRPLKLVSSTSGTILFKDNGDGTASLTGSAIFNVAPDKDNFIAKVDAPDGYVFTSVDWKINIDSSTQIIGINSQYAISETGSNWHALKVKIQDGNLLIGGSNNWNENNLITFNVSTTNLKTVSLAGSPATIGITKLN